MNAAGRKIINEAIETIAEYTDEDNAKEAGREAVREALDNARSVFESAADEEQEKFDNMPEGLQASERGEKLEAAAAALQDAVSTLEGIDISDDDEDWASCITGEVQAAIDSAEEAVSA